MLYRGNKKLSLLLEDGKPYSLYKGDKIIAGAMKKEVKGKSIGIKEPYNAKLPRVEIEGKGSQQKLEGKNLIPYPYILDNGDIEGLNITINPDNSITLEGTPKSVGFINLCNTYFGESTLYSTEGQPSTNNEYTLSGSKKNIEIGYDFRNLYTFIKVNAGIYINDTVYPQVELGTEATPYEPYCGGIPAPNPNYPIEPEFIEQDKLIQRRKNLFDINSPFDQFAAEAVKVEDGKLYIPYSEWNSKVGHFNQEIPVKNRRYTISAKVIKGGYRAAVSLYDAEGNLLDNTKVSDNELGTNGWTYLAFYEGWYNWKNEANFRSISINIPPIVKKIRLNIIGLSNMTPDKSPSIISEIQIEEGAATAYEPYVEPTITDIPVLRAIPNTDIRDTYNASTGELTRRVGELVCKGNEDWFYWTRDKAGAGLIGFYLYPLQQNKDGYCFSNIIPQSPHNNWGGSLFGIWANRGYIQMGFPLSLLPEYTTEEKALADFKNILKELYDKGKPMKIYYPLGKEKVEHYNPQEIKQHIGYTHLETIKDSEISATVYTEVK